MKPRAAAVAAFVLAALPGCGPVVIGPECWTRDHAPAPLSRTAVREPAPGAFRGRLALPDPSNPFVGLRFTGEHCHIRIRHEDGLVLAETSLLPEPVALAGAMGDGPWHIGPAPERTALVVQTEGGGVVSVTHTVFDAAGVLVYGACGNPRLTFVRECLIDR